MPSLVRPTVSDVMCAPSTSQNWQQSWNHENNKPEYHTHWGSFSPSLSLVSSSRSKLKQRRFIPPSYITSSFCESIKFDWNGAASAGRRHLPLKGRNYSWKKEICSRNHRELVASRRFEGANEVKWRAVQVQEQPDESSCKKKKQSPSASQMYNGNFHECSKSACAKRRRRPESQRTELQRRL